MVNFLPGITEARRWTTNSKTTIFRITHNTHLLKRIIHTLLYCSSIGGSEHIAVDRASLFIALYRRNLRLHVLYYITRHVLSNLRRGVRLIFSRGRRRERDRARSFQSRGPICRHTHIYIYEDDDSVAAVCVQADLGFVFRAVLRYIQCTYAVWVDVDDIEGC